MKLNVEQPRVSVLLPVYNGERYLRPAIDSILNQTFTNFEFLIIDDSSSDSTPAILAEYAQSDQRVRVIRNEVNHGMTETLNLGLGWARGEYIVRQDADDVSMPDRIAKQVKYLDKERRTSVVGSFIKLIDANDRFLADDIGPVKHPTTHMQLKWAHIFRSWIAHPSATMRKSMVQDVGGYGIDIKYSQDYDLWVRLSWKYELYVLPSFEVYKREWSENSNSQQKNIHEADTLRIMSAAISRLLGVSVPPTSVVSLRQVMKNHPLDKAEDISSVSLLIRRLLRTYLISNRYHISRSDLRWVKRHAASVLRGMAVTNARNHPAEATRSYIQAQLLEPRLPYHRVMWTIQKYGGRLQDISRSISTITY